MANINLKLSFKISIILSLSLVCCKHQESGDLILSNAQIFTSDTSQISATAFVVKNGEFIYVGDNEGAEKLKGPKTKWIDAKGNFIMPGIIESHGHFDGLGKGLFNLDLLDTKNWNEVISMVQEKVAQTPKGDWIVGRGWHQEKWDTLPEYHLGDYPVHHDLSAISPMNPVVLYHASGHAIFANEYAMNLVGVSSETPDPEGGHILRDENQEAIGVFEERAAEIITAAYNEWHATLDSAEVITQKLREIELAQRECLKYGVTSFQDAGATFDLLDLYERLAKEGTLDIRLWAMVRHSYEDMKDRLSTYPKIDVGDRRFTCRAIKSEIDGALGAYGAWLLKAYNDKPDFHGQNTTSLKEVSQIADLALANNMQLCVHAIGDRGNRVILDLFEGKIGEKEGDFRWRLEHAQHLHPDDIKRFKPLGAIASMQGIHCTSDAPFVEKRLGAQRAKEGAYAWRSLWDAGALVANGTDVPVERIDPMANFYATVTRKRKDNGMTFYTEQALSRDEALISMTINGAYAAFEDHYKGAIAPGMVADFIILDHNLLTCTEEEILETKVQSTFIDGIEVFRLEE